MPHRLPRPAALIALTLAGCLGATVVQAQTAPTGQRYMTWANRPADTTPGDVAAAQTRARNGMIPRRVAPSQALAPPVMQPPFQLAGTSRGLTPASAWLGPRVAPSYAPGSPDPTGYATDLQPVSAPAPAYEAPALRVAPPAPPAPIYTPAPAPVAAQPMAESAPSNDPNAPRRDAPIFRIQQQGAAPTADAAQAAPQSYAQAAPAAAQPGARYYSVHRDAGHAPDPTVMPEPVFFDSVTLDLAEPPAQELPTRDAQGRRRPVANENPSLP